METTYIKKSHPLYIVGKVFAIIEYISCIIALATFTVAFFVLAGTWQAIPEIVKEVPKEYMDILSTVFIVAGVVTLIVSIPVIIVGGIALKKIKLGKTRQELLPWSIVTLIFISFIPGVLLILASTLPACRETIVVE